jgi:Pvc16 N-terminal domain
MIQEAVEYVVNDLNAHFKRVLSPRPVTDLGVLSVILDQNGEIAVQEENALIFSVVNIMEEKKSGATNGNHERLAPLELNIYVLISGYFPGKLTGEALGFLSMVLEYFHENHSFVPSRSPGLHPGIHRMTWEIYNMDFMEQSNLWSAIGAKHMPSLTYKVRLQIVPNTKTLVKLPVIQSRETVL